MASYALDGKDSTTSILDLRPLKFFVSVLYSYLDRSI